MTPPCLPSAIRPPCRTAGAAPSALRLVLDVECLALVVGYGAFKALMNSAYIALVSNGAAAGWPTPLCAVAVSGAIMACSLALFAVGHVRPRCPLRPAVLAAIPLLVLIDLARPFFAGLLPGGAALAAAAAAYGFAAVVPNAAWLVPFVALRPRRCFVTLSAALFTGTLLAFTVDLLSPAARGACLAALGAVSTALYARASSGGGGRAAGPLPPDPAPRTSGALSTLRHLADPFIAYAVLCTALGFVTAFQSAGQPAPVHAYPGGLTGIAACALVAAASVADASLDMKKAFGRIFPAVALLAIALPFAGRGYGLAFDALLGFLNSIAGCSIVLLLVEWARSSQRSVVALAGLATFASRLVIALGLVAGDNLGAHSGADATVRSLIAVIVTVYLLMWAAATLARARWDKGCAADPESTSPSRGTAVCEGDDGREAREPAPDRLHARLEEVASLHRLTPRETDILLLLAQGRSASYAAQELDISPNTVRSYMKALYPKLGVHSKQQLIDLFEK